MNYLFRGGEQWSEHFTFSPTQFQHRLSRVRAPVCRLLCAARILEFALLSISSPEVPATVLRILVGGSGPSGTQHLGDRGDGIPVARSDRYREETIDGTEIADDLHVAPIQAKNESILSREDSQQPPAAGRKAHRH